MHTRHALLLATAVLFIVPVLFATAQTPTGGGAAPASQPAANPNSPIDHSVPPQQLGNGYKFTEGCTSDDKGNVYFVDQDNNRIHLWNAADNKISIFMEPTNYSNGMCLDNDGNLIACADGKNELWKISIPDKKVTVLLKDYQGKLLNGPNDVFVIPAGPLKGDMYITDPLFARRWWAGFRTNDSQQPGQYVFYVSADGKTIKPVITDMRTPNGIIGTPDGKTLYASDFYGNATNTYTINPDGTLSDKKKFNDVGSDGMTIDSDGNIYTTNGNTRQGLQVWDKNGKMVDQFNVGCANVCIGGKDLNTLFVCTQNAVWGLKLKTKRVGPQ